MIKSIVKTQAGHSRDWGQFLHIPNTTRSSHMSWKWRSFPLDILWFLDLRLKCICQHSVKEKGLFLWYFLAKWALCTGSFLRKSSIVHSTALSYESQNFILSLFSPNQSPGLPLRCWASYKSRLCPGSWRQVAAHSLLPSVVLTNASTSWVSSGLLTEHSAFGSVVSGSY